jgi:hypothetical protein
MVTNSDAQNMRAEKHGQALYLARHEWTRHCTRLSDPSSSFMIFHPQSRSSIIRRLRSSCLENLLLQEKIDFKKAILSSALFSRRSSVARLAILTAITVVYSLWDSVVASWASPNYPLFPLLLLLLLLLILLLTQNFRPQKFRRNHRGSLTEQSSTITSTLLLGPD